MMRLFFLVFTKMGLFKKITNLGKSCQFDTTSYAEVVPIRHDFCHVILKSCQLGMTSALSYWSRVNLARFLALSYWSRANLARLLPCHTDVMSTWHDFCHVIILFVFLILLFIYWVVSYVMLKINLIHSFLRVLVLRNKKLDNCVWIMFELNE